MELFNDRSVCQTIGYHIASRISPSVGMRPTFEDNVTTEGQRRLNNPILDWKLDVTIITVECCHL